MPQSLAVGNPALGTVDRRPQTAITPAQQNAPFVRKSRKATSLQFDSTANAFAATVTPQLKAVAGYLRSYALEVIASGGSGASVTGTADAPFNVISLLTLRDATGQPIINTDGFGLYAFLLYANMIGGAGMQDIAKYDSYSAIAAGTGAFTIPFYLPFELDTSGYCALPSLSSAALPQLQVILAAQATVIGGTVTTAPTMELRMYANFWMAPVDDPTLGPPGVGSTSQLNFVQAPTTWAKSTNTRIPLPIQATWIHTLVMLLKDTGASNARVDNWPTSDLTFWLDGVPIQFESLNIAKDRMNYEFGAIAALNTGRPTGAIAYTWRNSSAQSVDNSSTHDYLLYTTPASLLEIGGTSGSGGTGPYGVFAYTGYLFAKGGIPYTHLAA